MALHTVTLVLDDTWRLISNSLGRMKVTTDSVDGGLFYFGDAAPAPTYSGGQSDRRMDITALDTKVWAKAASKRAEITVTRVVDAANHQEVILGDLGLSASSFASTILAGADVATITGRVSGDGVKLLSVAGGLVEQSSDGTKIIRALGPISVKTPEVVIELEQSHPLAANSPKRTKFTVKVTGSLGAGGGVQLDPALPFISVIFPVGDSRTQNVIDKTSQGTTGGRRFWNVWGPAAVTAAGGRIRIANDYKFQNAGTMQSALAEFDDTVARAQAEGAQAIAVMLGEADTIAWDQPGGYRDCITQMSAKCYAAGMYLIIPNGAPLEAPSTDLINRWLFQRTADKTVLLPNGMTNIIVADTMPGFIVAGTGLDGTRTFTKLSDRFTDGRHHQPRGSQAWGRPVGAGILASGRAAPVSTILKPYVLGEGGTININPTFSLQTGASSTITGPIFAPGGGALPTGAGGKPDNTAISLTGTNLGTLSCDLDYTTLDGMNALRLHVYGRVTAASNPVLSVAAVLGAVPNPSKGTGRARVRTLSGALGLLGVQGVVTGNGTTGAAYVQDARYQGARPAFTFVNGFGPSGRISSWLEDGFDGYVVTPPVDVATTKACRIDFLIDGASITQDNFGSGYDAVPPAVDFTVLITGLAFRVEG